MINKIMKMSIVFELILIIVSECKYTLLGEYNLLILIGLIFLVICIIKKEERILLESLSILLIAIMIVYVNQNKYLNASITIVIMLNLFYIIVNLIKVLINLPVTWKFSNKMNKINKTR